MKYLLILFLCLSSVVYGAAFTSTQTGNFNDGGTWGNTSPGVAGTDFPNPAGGDTFTVSSGHVVTIPSGYSTISSGIIYGTLTINGTITLDAELQLYNENSTLNGTSGTINLNGSFIDISDLAFYKYPVINLSGTAENPFVINGSGGFGDTPYWHPVITFNYVELNNLTVFYFWDRVECNIQNSTFSGFSTGTFRVYSKSEDKDTIFKNCKFVNCTASANALQFGTSSETYTGLGSGVREISNCTFETCSSIYMQNGLKFNDNVVKNTRVYEFGNKQDLEFKNNIFWVSFDTDSGGAIPCGQHLYDNNYMYQEDANPKWAVDDRTVSANLNSMIFKNNIIENDDVSGDGGDALVILDDKNCEIYNNLILDNTGGVFINAFTNEKTANVEAYNNTLYYSQQTYGSLGITESGGSFAGTLVSFKNNLAYNTGSLSSNYLFNLANLSIADQLTYTDYNALYNFPQTIAAYNNVSISGKSFGDTGFGGNDIYDDPQFVDPTRNLATWDAYNGGAGTAENAITEMLKLNDSDFDSNYTVEKLNAWVKAGFAPTNPVYATASDTGSYIGAVEPVLSGNPFMSIFKVGR